MKPEQKTWPACGERRNLETRPKVTIVLDERGEPVGMWRQLGPEQDKIAPQCAQTTRAFVK